MTTVIYSYSGSGKARRCDASCYNAIGPVCVCLCGGRNHGQGYTQALVNNEAAAGLAGVVMATRRRPDVVIATRGRWSAVQGDLGL